MGYPLIYLLGIGVAAAMYVMHLWANPWLCGLALFGCFTYKSKHEHKLIFPLLTISIFSGLGLYLLLS
jgi:hypothetical protein